LSKKECSPNLSKQSTSLKLIPFDNQRLVKLCGQCDEHLKQIETRLNVIIHNRGNSFEITGDEHSISKASDVLTSLYAETELHHELTPNKVHLILQENKAKSLVEHPKQSDHINYGGDIVVHGAGGAIKARSDNQKHYLQTITQYAINFGIGPAGTGKTFLAVASAVNALENQQVKRILLVRPVVEAGENLGFLPGDLAQKIDPYLRPLYDGLNDILGAEKVTKLRERNIIEVAPLAYMRGRTLGNAFIILDESQNCTKEQMKMFLTRIGFGSTAVITGDLTQIDLPKGKVSGLRHAMEVLKGLEGISFTFFDSHDVVRHPLIESIVQAYAKHANENHQ
jgi:phosphate starvation-inducible protein PhoH and related proteins